MIACGERNSLQLVRGPVLSLSFPSVEQGHSELSIMFTLRLLPGAKGDLFSIVDSKNRLQLQVGFDEGVQVTMPEATGRPVRGGRTSLERNLFTQRTYKLGSRIDDNE